MWTAVWTTGRARTAFGFLVFPAFLLAQHGSTPGVRIDESGPGAKIFRAQCAGCHGLDGSGAGAGPSLNSGTFRHGSSDDAIVATISKGVRGTAMPAFSFDMSQMPQIVAHIRSLGIMRAAGDVSGDAKAGETVFRANCAGCHTPVGAFTAPDLSRVAARLTAAQLRQSIEDPHAAVSPEYWSVSGRTRSGQALNAIRLNEDTNSIQLRDRRTGKLFSVLKKDVAEFEIVRTSPMPAFKGKLTEGQIGDIVAYLVKGGNQ